MYIFIKLVGRELSNIIRTDIYLSSWMDFMSNQVGTEAPNFVNLGLPAVNASDEFKTFDTPAIRIIMITDGYHWYVLGHVFWRNHNGWNERYKVRTKL